MRRLLFSSLFMLSLVPLGTQPSAAGTPAVCNVYAAAAVSQQQKNLNLGCGYAGPRWSKNVAGHFAWCMGAGAPAIQAETNARASMLAAWYLIFDVRTGHPLQTVTALGKFALRGLAQSMARELSPQGIHVAHFVIDGGVRSVARGRTEGASDIPDSLLDPDAIAEAYMHVLKQPRSAWTSEVELRPWVERF